MQYVLKMYQVEYFIFWSADFIDDNLELTVKVFNDLYHI